MRTTTDSPKGDAESALESLDECLEFMRKAQAMDRIAEKRPANAVDVLAKIRCLLDRKL